MILPVRKPNVKLPSAPALIKLETLKTNAKNVGIKNKKYYKIITTYIVCKKTSDLLR